MSGSIAALFQRLTQGVYVVGVAHGEVRNAFTAAWVMQVSFDPLLLALSINPHHSSYGLLKEGRAFSVNVLKKGQLELAAHYGRPAGPDKLALMKWTTGRIGVPLLLAGAMHWAGLGQQLGVRDRLPTPQPLCDQLRASSIVVSVQDDHVLWIDAPVNTGRPRVRAGVRTSREVPGRAIGGLQQDFSRPVQLRCVRVPGPFSFPIIENARRLLPLLHRFAPVSRGQAAILLPCAAA
jgi:hypothetical protein